MAAYRTLLGRAPTEVEASELVAALLRGDSPAWLLGRLRYGNEGRVRTVDIPGLLPRYLAQRASRMRGFGPLVAWAMAVVRLPASLRYFRAVRVGDLDRNAHLTAALGDVRDTLVDLAQRVADLPEALAAMSARLSGLNSAIDADRASIASIVEDVASTVAASESLHTQVEAVAAQVDAVAAQVDASHGDIGRLVARATGTEAAIEDHAAHLAGQQSTLGQLAERVAFAAAAIESLRTRLDAAAAQGDASRGDIGSLVARAVGAEAAIGGLAAHLAGQQSTLGQLAERGLRTESALIALEPGLAAMESRLAALEPKLRSILPPDLGTTYEVAGPALVAPAIARRIPGPPVTAASLSPDERYALFEDVFYDSNVVLEKQRVYIGEIERALPSRLPFLDLGCGRGEFLSILREAGIDALGIDINSASLRTAREHGLRVVEDEVVAFLESDRSTYCGASLLQVAEHLTAAQFERTLALVAERLAPGALLIVETPNPLSPFALAHFHTDPTHVTPLPPERVRFAIEAAGFCDTRTLFQGRIPPDQFAGPDPRAYYMDYAVTARRVP
ncbi:MAG: methyltransferase domain-containing protein [Proteobacteria bacterium]|nr:methyltransferase domain-containing protein [Pseudomonadota bacterium]